MEVLTAESLQQLAGFRQPDVRFRLMDLIKRGQIIWPRRQRRLSEFVRIKPVFRWRQISSNIEIRLILRCGKDCRDQQKNKCT